jgi:S-adenosylmethionine hydrolase
VRIGFPCLVALLAACAAETADRGSARSVLFLSDFGTRDGAVAVCKGVMWEIDPSLRIVDLTHEIEPYDVESAAEVLEQAIPFYPSGSVAVAVVDPGVGSERKSIAIRTGRGHFLVGPDNGIFTLVIESEGLDRVVELTNPRFLRQAGSFTFHGRDVFSPAAAHLAAGVPIDSLGPALADGPVRLPLHKARISRGGRGTAEVEGVVRYVEDPYGNVVTNVPAALVDSAGFRVGDTVRVNVGRRSLAMPFARTFSDVRAGTPLAVMHSRGLLSFSINQGSFASRYGMKRGDTLTVTTSRP